MTELGKVESELIKALAYNQVFLYPLHKDELQDWVPEDCRSEIFAALQRLSVQGLVDFDGEFCALEDLEANLPRRLKGNKRARLMLSEGEHYFKLISSFPFVRGVFLSGSISKQFIDDDGDIDYFIITARDRLWLCRTLLVLYKKIVLLNNRKFFCVNYFVTENALEIQEKNRFTATEIRTLLPVYNPVLWKDFLTKNDWVLEYGAVRRVNAGAFIAEEKSKKIKSFLENLLGGSLGLKLDHFFQKMTVKRWSSKFSDFSEEDMELTLKSTRTVSKHHPSNFQRKVLKRLADIIAKFETDKNVKLANV